MEVSQGILMKRVKIDHPDAKEIFINAIHDNQVIAYPTDTIYGLGTAMNNDEGIERINLMKMLKQIEKDMMEALKNKNKEKAGALRLLISKCKNKAIEVGHELSDTEVIKVLQTAAKQHKESIRMYKEGNRDDLVEAEMNELQFVESYLPSMMNEEEVRSLIENIISEVGASQMSDFGKVMPQVMKKGAGKVDGNVAQSIVKELLS